MLDAHHLKQQSRLVTHVLEFRRTLRFFDSASDADQNAEGSGIKHLSLSEIEHDGSLPLE